MKHRILLLSILACCLAAGAQNASVDKQKILLGEQFHLELKGLYPESRIDWPVLDSLDHFEILDRSSIDTQRSVSGVQLTQSFTLTSFDSGRWQIPPMQLGLARTAAINIDVVFSSPFDPSQPYHDVKEIIEVQPPIASKWYWYLVFALLLVALFLLFFPRGRKKEKREFVSDEGAYRSAMKGLDRLKSREQPDAKEFYTELVDIFRTYLQRRRNIQSFSKTTDDLSVQISALNIPRDEYQELVQTLRLSDMAKFARFQPPSSENAAAVEIIRQNIMTIENLPDAVQLV